MQHVNASCLQKGCTGVAPFRFLQAIPSICSLHSGLKAVCNLGGGAQDHASRSCITACMVNLHDHNLCMAEVDRDQHVACAHLLKDDSVPPDLPHRQTLQRDGLLHGTTCWHAKSPSTSTQFPHPTLCIPSAVMVSNTCMHACRMHASTHRSATSYPSVVWWPCQAPRKPQARSKPG